MMVAAILAAVVLYTFIGFIPGTDETGVLAPVTLAIILAGAPPHVVLAFFIAGLLIAAYCVTRRDMHLVASSRHSIARFTAF